MNLGCSLVVFTLGCLTGALGQLHCTPESFKTNAFDVFSFRMIHAYLDFNRSLELYEYYNGTSIYFVDFNNQTIYINNGDGTCGKYVNSDMETLPVLFSKAEELWHITTPTKVDITGYSMHNGSFGLRTILTEPVLCQSVCMSYLINDELKLAFLYDGPYDDTYGPADVQKVLDVKAEFEASSCIPVNEL
ncbi:hypothetical protein ElyMa_000863900 [Elysia marginata]|uniref:Uncharacterized protein n=1 Tax=Elysia marginata TaxID=1093978 RepID=A0AAV4H3W4_9GAST|nr:hypothetical protein ElyMa_000863900 [Elysia marginata]